MTQLLLFCYCLFVAIFLLFLSISILLQVYQTQKFASLIKTLKNQSTSIPLAYQNFYRLGQWYLRKKNYTNAIVSFKKSLQCWNKDDKVGLTNLYRTIAFIYFKLKEYDYAIYYYKKANQFVFDGNKTLINLAISYEKLNMLEEAAGMYSKVLSSDENEKTVVERLASIQKSRAL